MKANELMIGDWVSLDGYVLKVTDLSANDYGEYAPIQLSSKEGCAGTIDAESIPLTKEILEKNGIPTDGNVFWYGNDDDNDDVNSLELCYYKGDLLWTINGFEYDIMTLHYVHELQHALRLCGLHELADNFKVEEE